MDWVILYQLTAKTIFHRDRTCQSDPSVLQLRLVLLENSRLCQGEGYCQSRNHVTLYVATSISLDKIYEIFKLILSHLILIFFSFVRTYLYLLKQYPVKTIFVWINRLGTSTIQMMADSCELFSKNVAEITGASINANCQWLESSSWQDIWRGKVL